jgi:hypothetical protein
MDKIRLNAKQYVIKQGVIKRLNASEHGCMFMLSTAMGSFPVDFGKYDFRRSNSVLAEGDTVVVYGYIRYSSGYKSHKIEAVKVSKSPVDYCYFEAYPEEIEHISEGRTRVKTNHLSLDTRKNPAEVYNCYLDVELFGKINDKLKDYIQPGYLYQFTGHLENDGKHTFLTAEHVKRHKVIER